MRPYQKDYCAPSQKDYCAPIISPFQSQAFAKRTQSLTDPCFHSTHDLMTYDGTRNEHLCKSMKFVRNFEM